MRFVSCLVIFVVIILFSGVVQAGNIIVEPTEYNVDLISGDTIIRPITITWTGKTAVVGFIETDIAPDDAGIDITYSKDPVVLYPSTPYAVNMTIATAINLVPGDYVITTLVFTEIEKIIEYRGGGGGTTIILYENETIEIENTTRLNELLDIIQQLKDEVNATKDNYTEQILLMIDELIDFIESQQEPEEKKDESLSFLLLLVAIIVVIIFIILMAYLCHKFRVLKSQKIKETKENETETEK